MAWVATLSVEVLNTAVPAEFSNVVPRIVVPSLKVTDPVGVPEPATLAVKVTDWLVMDGFALEVKVVVVVSCPTGAAS